MEISGTGLASLTGQHSSASLSSLKVKSQPLEQHKAHHHERHHHHGRSHGRALSALRVEIRQALSLKFQLDLMSAPASFGQNTGDLSSADVAAQTLGAAGQIASRSPLEASDQLADLRETVNNAAKDVRNSLHDDNHDDVDTTVDRVSEGLDNLEEDAARNTVSTASVLSAETTLKQRSSIRIRTQEGDIVRFDLRRIESMSLQDVAFSDGDASFSSTEIEFSSQSRMVLRVKGDLNEAEQAAIQNVFAQAEAIADEFFNGDLGAAFNMASGLEYDVEQLSKVNMRFRERQVSSTSFAAIGASTPAPATSPTPEPTTDVGRPARDLPAPMDRSTVESPTVVDGEAPLAAAPDATVQLEDAIGDFMNMLSSFLQSVNDGFELESGSFRYFLSESFKLEILKSVFQVGATEDSGEAASTAVAVIDSVAEANEESV